MFLCKFVTEYDDEILELAEETVVFMMSYFIHFKRTRQKLCGVCMDISLWWNIARAVSCQGRQQIKKTAMVRTKKTCAGCPDWAVTGCKRALDADLYCACWRSLRSDSNDNDQREYFKVDKASSQTKGVLPPYSCKCTDTDTDSGTQRAQVQQWTHNRQWNIIHLFGMQL